MRKVLRVLAVVVAILFAGVQFVRPERANPPVEAGRSLESPVAVPAEVASVLDRACMDCHSNRTRWPWYSHVAPASWLVADHVNEGRAELNFSDWARYDPNEMGEVLEQVCREARAGQMPLASYVVLHPSAKLTPNDVSTLCDWTRAEGDRLSARTAGVR